MTAPLPLAGRSVAVSGSSRGIGLEVARALRAQGAAVVLNGRDADAVAAAVESLGHAPTVGSVVGSAADPEVAERLVATAEAMAPLAAMVNVAGTAEPPGSSILTVTSAQWHELVDAHLHATFETCRAAAPLLVEHGGAIVNTSSHAHTGAYGGTGYAAGKGGVNSLTYALAAELAEHGVRVNAVCPGARTRLSTGEDYEAGVRDLNRRGLLDDLMLAGSLAPPPPEHAAATYAYLAGPLSAGITGRILSAAGGYVGSWDRPHEQLLAFRDHTDAPPYSPEELDALVRASLDS